MASLKEIKTRIQSVQGTLKITSAMKMIASAKLHRVQAMAQSLASYKSVLSQIAAAACADPELAVCMAIMREACSAVALSVSAS